MLPAPLRSPRPLLLVAALAAPLALSACAAQSSNSSSFKGAKKDVQAVITKLSDFADDRNSASICKDLFTPTLQAQFAKVGGGKCATAVDKAVRNADYTRLSADSIELNGTDTDALRAVAVIQVQKNGPKRSITLVRSDAKSAWRINAFASTVSKSEAATTPAATTPAASTPTTP